MVKTPPSDIFTSSSFSRFSDGDPADIVYFANHSMYFDEAFILMSQQQNYSWKDRKEIYLIPIVEQNTNFKYPLAVNQKFKISTAITHIGSRSFRSNHAIYTDIDGNYKLISYGYLNRVSVDAKSFKPIKVPAELKLILQNYHITSEKWDNFISKFL